MDTNTNEPTNTPTEVRKVNTDEVLKAEIEALEKKLADAKRAQQAARPKTVRFAVSEKGAVSVYGLRRFPITLYRQEWEAILTRSADMLTFISNNSNMLKTKGQVTETEE